MGGGGLGIICKLLIGIASRALHAMYDGRNSTALYVAIMHGDTVDVAASFRVQLISGTVC